MWGNESCQKQGDYEAMLRDSERTGKQNRKPGIAQKKKKKCVRGENQYESGVTKQWFPSSQCLILD